jgi:hypothetical protein
LRLGAATPEDPVEVEQETAIDDKRETGFFGSLKAYGSESSIKAAEGAGSAYGQRELVFGKDYYLLRGSVYYLIDNLHSGTEPGFNILGFRLNSREANKPHAIWYHCGTSNNTARGPDLTSPVMRQFGSTCNFRSEGP